VPLMHASLDQRLQSESTSAPAHGRRRSKAPSGPLGRLDIGLLPLTLFRYRLKHVLKLHDARSPLTCF